MTDNIKKSCVIGWPIAHSRSPLIHGYWLNQHGIAGTYERMPVQPDELEHFFETLRTGAFFGCNVTLPHKHNALAFVDHVDDRAKRIGALNTVWKQNGQLYATSTDGPGFIANLKATLPAFKLSGSRATVLGAGGSARAIIDEILRGGCESVTVSNRTRQRAEELVEVFGHAIRVAEGQTLVEHLAQTDILINTTSAGIGNTEKPDVPWHALKPEAVVADINYVPLITPFLQEARANGHRTVTGLGMLLHQAVLGFEKWFGVTPQVTDDLYDLVAKDIDPGFSR